MNLAVMIKGFSPVCISMVRLYFSGYDLRFLSSMYFSGHDSGFLLSMYCKYYLVSLQNILQLRYLRVYSGMYFSGHDLRFGMYYIAITCSFCQQYFRLIGR